MLAYRQKMYYNLFQSRTKNVRLMGTYIFRKEKNMLITVEHAEKVRVKRGRLDLTKSATAKKLNVTPRTLKLIEAGNYDAPKRIYESVMNWLIED